MKQRSCRRFVALLLATLCLVGCIAQRDPKEDQSTQEGTVMTDHPTQSTDTLSTAGQTQSASDPTQPTVTYPDTQPVTETPTESPTQPATETPTESPTQPTTQPVVDTYALEPLTYPKSAVKTLFWSWISESSLCARAAGGSDYLGNRHYSGTNMVISPYFEATVDAVTLPVYATPVYVATDNSGALHSFASVDVCFGAHTSVQICVTVQDSIPLHAAQVFAQEHTEAKIRGQTITFEATQHGVYTLVINDSQKYALTVFVRSYRDEGAEIAAYQTQYGEENVLIYEPGIHEIDYVLLQSSNMVLYLKSGAILLPKHTIDIMSDEAAAAESELGAKYCNELGLNRYPVINGYKAENLVIAGRGTVNMTQLDWHERRGIVFSLCNNVTMDGVIIINPCEWAFITYRCQNVTVTQCAVLGYRTNSDAFAICNSIDVEVTDCFARTGDDMFEVKTLGGVAGAVSRNITFQRCQAWGSKARCFGVIGEIEKDVSNILFEDGIVIFRDATWDNNRIGSLVVLRECGSGVVDGVTFRNIEIHYDAGRPIQVGVYSNDLQESVIRNVVFENISGNAQMNAQARGGDSSNVLQILLKNVRINGAVLTKSNLQDHFDYDRDGLVILE